jgi:hypothetical protein
MVLDWRLRNGETASPQCNRKRARPSGSETPKDSLTQHTRGNQAPRASKNFRLKPPA